MSQMRIHMFKPFVNERAVTLVSEVLRSGWVGEGPKAKAFEEQIGKQVGARYPVAVNSGTSALHLAVVLAGAGPGDEVITTAQTMLATTTAILQAGATPVYADVDYLTGNLSPADVARRVTPRTKAIIAVDWAGYPCDWDELLAIGAAHGLTVIEDAAHALGASYRGRPVGAIAPITCFSFQGIKHLTTGDGGLVTVPTAGMHERALQLRWFGIDRARRVPSILGEALWDVAELGYKYHMNDIAAAIGLGNLEDLDATLVRRHQIVDRYRAALAAVPGVTLFDRASDRQSADWLFTMHVERREDFCRMMADRGIMVSVVHLRIDRNTVAGGERRDLPQLERFTGTHISLPLHPYLTDDDIGEVAAAVAGGW